MSSKVSTKISSKKSVKKTIRSVLPASNVTTFENVKRNVANKTANKTADKTSNKTESRMQNAAEHIEKANEQIACQLKEAACFNRSNLEAAVQAANVVAEGIKDVNETVFNCIQQSLQSAMSTGKAMLGVKSLRDLMELQSEFIKSTFDTVMADTTKISEIAVRCSSQAVEPINARVTEVVEKVSSKVKRAA